jgi:hypothetical protein
LLGGSRQAPANLRTEAQKAVASVRIARQPWTLADHKPNICQGRCTQCTKRVESKRSVRSFSYLGVVLSRIHEPRVEGSRPPRESRGARDMMSGTGTSPWDGT